MALATKYPHGLRTIRRVRGRARARTIPLPLALALGVGIGISSAFTLGCGGAPPVAEEFAAALEDPAAPQAPAAVDPAQQAALVDAPEPGSGDAWEQAREDIPLLPASYDPRQSLAPLVKKVGPAVVSVRSIRDRGAHSGRGLQLPFNLQIPGMDMPAPEGMGSGFVISADGKVVTNHHVVKDADRFEVKLADGRVFEARVLGSDPYTDIAVLELQGASGLTVAPMGKSDKLQVGDWVMALGSPMGLEQSATVGIISAKGRGSMGLYRNSYIDFLQTDAAISPGNSGGPLFNLKGEVVGINTAISAYGRGIGFAVPISQAKKIIPQLEKNGKVVRGWLGITGRDIEPALGKRPDPGAVVGNVHPGTPAAGAGLMPQDRIIALDGTQVRDFGDFRGRVAEHSPGDSIRLTVVRDGKEQSVRVTLGQLPDEQTLATLGRGGTFKNPFPGNSGAPSTPSPSNDLYGSGKPRLGVEVNTNKTNGKLEVMRVQSGTVAQNLGLQPGDIIESINGQSIATVDDVARALSTDRHHVEVTVKRGNATHTSVMDRR